MTDVQTTDSATAATSAATTVTDTTVKDAVQKTETTTPDFPDNWREKLAGDNTKRLEELKRYASPKAWDDSTAALRQRMSAGELKAALPKNATPEQITEWRKDNGVPETPDKYDYKLADTAQITDIDKPFINAIIADMHSKNASNEVVEAAVKGYLKGLEGLAADRETKDLETRTASEDALRAEWGADFTANINGVRGLFDMMGDDFNELSLASRAPDGSLWQDNPVVLRAFAQLARTANPLAVITPNESGDRMASLDAEIKDIEKKMGSKAYTQEDRARIAELYDIRDRSKGRAA